ncbi:granulin a [Cyprinodon tularosa]|uniref:granulin a n=1 Tax=Cyprinodon tularosa TaxID=77115 RepID=UPI0018E26E20|nr:granulin a [Cyprinodon tularosa]
MKTWVVICWAAFALVCADECPDGGSCEEGQTCCSSPNNGYGCCPFDQAECCGDHVHCCPADTLCNPDTSSCVNATVSIPWQERTSALQPTLSKSFRMIKSYMGEDDDNICPDQSRCPAEFSCLKALTKFGCCPLAKGVSCSDGKHCCPEGHQCSLDSRSCIKKENVAAVLCSDGVSECPDETTCCETPEGKWGCCPMPKAVCCEDKEHCCPDGTTCDTEQMKCISISTKKVLPMWAKFPARLRADWENQKEDEKITAKGADGDETEKSTEVTTANPVPSLKEEVTESSVAKADAANNVPCNETAACPDDSTCCKNSAGDWACCPLPEAVCCEDFIHCCPKGKKCNMEAGKCEDATCSVPWFNKISTIPRKVVKVQVKNVTCDETSSCPDETTCCKTKEGGWACCPMPEAVCCEDFIHCCPKGKKCNLAAQTCDDGLQSVPWVEKVPSIPRLGEQTRMENVTCDGTASCPDGTTCCKTKEGGWACCPMPEAVCCEDFIHCCPKGKKCNLAAQTCDDGLQSVPWVEKVPSIPRLGEQTRMENVTCDGTASCPDGTTCCKTKEGGWACCPMPEAVCCEDFIHCCPKGKKCNLAAQTCDDGLLSLPWVEKTPSIPRLEEKTLQKDVTCDATASCPDETTCCKNKEGGWACCPLPKAVCCHDHEHCCPEGTTCDATSTSCLQASGSTPMFKKIPVFTTTAPTTVATTTESLVTSTPETNVEIPSQDDEEEGTEEDRNQCDEHTSCPLETTCCFMAASKKWGCCPLPKAVCCTDGSHCCPEGYKCNEEENTCLQGEVQIPWYTKIPAISRVQADDSNMRCDDDHHCPEHTSCCMLFTGEWGCCPLQNAVCCSDKEHCCPQGYSCDVLSKTCQKAIMLQLETLPLTPVFLPEYHLQLTPLKHKDVLCDEQTSCPDNETCCRTSSTTWGCCPSPNAVCCSDMKHCCPQGSTCTDEGSCTQSSPLDWLN